MKRLTAIALGLCAILLVDPAMAQVQVGTGANGGLCYGVNCGDGAPPNVGVGANGGVCFGPNCGPNDNPNTAFTHQPIQQPNQFEYRAPSISQEPIQQLSLSPYGAPSALPGGPDYMEPTPYPR
jgi:hypothetical protein